jgi:hypothetical protein
MRSITALLAVSILACLSSDVTKDQPLSRFQPGDDGRPALPADDGTARNDAVDQTFGHRRLARTARKGPGPVREPEGARERAGARRPVSPPIS